MFWSCVYERKRNCNHYSLHLQILQILKMIDVTVVQQWRCMHPTFENLLLPFRNLKIVNWELRLLSWLASGFSAPSDISIFASLNCRVRILLFVMKWCASSCNFDLLYSVYKLLYCKYNVTSLFIYVSVKSF